MIDGCILFQRDLLLEHIIETLEAFYGDATDHGSSYYLKSLKAVIDELMSGRISYDGEYLILPQQCAILVREM